MIENIDIELQNNYYTAKMMNENIVIYNNFYNTRRGIFIIYVLLEFLGSPGFDLLRIPRRYVVNKDASVVKLSKTLKLNTDGGYHIVFRKTDVRRWFIGVVIPIILTSVVFLITLYPAIVFMMVSNMSIASMTLFSVLFIVNVCLLWIDIIIIKHYREYQKANRRIY